MKKKSIKLLVVLACVLMALGMAGCGKKAYKTFPEKYKLASVDVRSEEHTSELQSPS